MRILNYLTYSTEPASLTVRGQNVRVKSHQIIVWLSITSTDRRTGGPRTPALPAIIDPGNNFTLSIFKSQLIQWAGMGPESLRFLGRIKEGGELHPRHQAAVWLHANVPGSFHRQIEREPYRLTLAKGIVIYPDAASTAPHLPLLGLRALTENNLHLTIDAKQRMVWLRSEDLRTRLLRWLM